MFRQVRYQTGEIEEIITEMKSGKIPCMDVNDTDEYKWFLDRLSEKGITRLESIALDKNARDRIKEQEFEYRAAFTDQNDNRTMYIDFYFEPDEEETYDPIFGD